MGERSLPHPGIELCESGTSNPCPKCSPWRDIRDSSRASPPAVTDGAVFRRAGIPPLIEAGEGAKTEQLVAELQGKPQKQTRSLAFMIAGDIALKQNRLPEAVDAVKRHGGEWY